MTNRLSGPHFCVGTGQIVASQIFSDLVARAERKGGGLSTRDLRSAAAEFLDNLPNNFALYESVYSACMSTLNGSTSRIFDRTSLPRFVFFAYTIDVVKPVFHSQIERFGREWALWLAEAMATTLAGKLHIDVLARLNEIYDRLAVTLGHDVSNDHILRDGATVEMLRDYCSGLAALTDNGTDVEHMSNWLNESLRRHYKIVGANPLLVVNTQCRDLVRRLGEEKYTNPYRRALFTGTREAVA